VPRFLLGSAALAALIFLLPLALRAYADRIAPHAPRSEFAFLLMVAVVCGVATRRLGVYYLVGAFLVGVAAKRFRDRLPAMSSERMLHALEAFASVFTPFYFFKVGLHLHGSELGWGSLAAGLVFLALFVPLRAGKMIAHRWLAARESPAFAFHIAVPLIPTLVFSLVMAEALLGVGGPSWAAGGLVIYTIVNTAIPGFVLRKPLALQAPMSPALSPTAPAPAFLPEAAAASIASDPKMGTPESTQLSTVPFGGGVDGT
jgi:Kef-type K+ transport system membrane component KefB